MTAQRPALDVGGYLRRLGVEDPGPQSVPALRRLHAAHVERIPDETVWIALGRARSIEPAQSCERIVAGYGGYCFQLNGAFASLLSALGYQVTRHAVLWRRVLDTPPRADP